MIMIIIVIDLQNQIYFCISTYQKSRQDALSELNICSKSIFPSFMLTSLETF